MSTLRAIIVFLFFLISISIPVFADFPLIQETVAYKDPLFRQQQKETERWYYNQAHNLPLPPMTIYSYEPDEGETLIGLAAAFNLTIDSIATLNNMQNIHDFKTTRTLLIPSSPGIFINQDNKSNWSENLEKEIGEQEFETFFLSIKGKKQRIRYFPDLRLPEMIRLRFIKQLFLFPLDEAHITSPYGYRIHPFTGKWELHIGTDYRAPIGTSVKSCADGVIFSTGELEDYGKFIIIKHRNGYSSMYGHLNSILVDRGQEVSEGDIIAESGNTGLSTGPHLHFEIRKNGLPQNPENLLTKSGK